jgi:group I intron endonuclease
MSIAKKGKSFSNEHKLKLSISRLGEKNHLYGKLLDEKHIKKISLVMLGEKNHRYKKVFVYSKDNSTKLLFEFSIYTEASKYFNCSYTTISNYINSFKIYKDKWLLFSYCQQ